MLNNRIYVCIFFITTLLSFSCKDKSTMNKTDWKKLSHFRAELILDSQKNIRLPFLCNQTYNQEAGAYVWEILNGEERILVDEITVKDEKFIVKLPVFNSEIIAQVDSDGVMRGTWINHARKDMNIIAFEADPTNWHYRFYQDKEMEKSQPLEKWEVDFSPGTPDTYKALGVFEREANRLEGTFLTETGDYRYLAGNTVGYSDADAIGDTIYLSSFDGSHAFLFKAVKQNDGTLQGEFWSGIHHYEKWTAKRNEVFELPKADTIIKAATSEKIDFSFLNLDSTMVTLNDDKYKNKAVIIQLMGSWCPNCMDETAYLSELYKEIKPKNIEIVALCFEKNSDFSTAKTNVVRLKKRFNSEYDFLIAGSASKKEAAEKLPWLSNVASFPTTILIDNQHQIKKIYSGFSGPATGKYYLDFKREFEREINALQ